MRRAGLFAVACLLGTSCAALGYAGNCEGTSVIASFEQVGDLVEAANVQSSDVVIGTVQEIELKGWNAAVTMCLEADQQIPADVEARVRTTSLLGEKFVDLRPRSEGPPYLEDGAVIGVEDTGKATELEDVFAELATILGSGNLEDLNRFTASQADILRDNADELRTVLAELHEFTDTIAVRKDDIAAAIDALDHVAREVVAEQGVLRRFLDSFADSSGVLADQKGSLNDLLFSLDRFTRVSVRLLEATESGLDDQFRDLRPVLRTVVRNSARVRETIQTLAVFSQYFPESMPGDYLQLDVCQALPEEYGQGTTCPQSDAGDPSTERSPGGDGGRDTSDLERLLLKPLEGAR
ncbi:MAG TPA: MCE family protein [Actinomycetota bacterium]|nr:MCE family protein [Actinomycetota bacterium]